MNTNIPNPNQPKKPDISVRKNVRAAGAVILAKNTGRLLFCFRKSASRERLAEWNLWGAFVALDESPEDSVVKWTKKLSGYNGHFSEIIPLYSFFTSDTNFRYYNFLLVVEKEFPLVVDKTRITDYKWVNIDELPSPLHPLVKELFGKVGDKIRAMIEKNVLRESLSENIIKLKDLIKELLQ